MIEAYQNKSPGTRSEKNHTYGVCAKRLNAEFIMRKKLKLINILLLLPFILFYIYIFFYLPPFELCHRYHANNITEECVCIAYDEYSNLFHYIKTRLDDTVSVQYDQW